MCTLKNFNNPAGSFARLAECVNIDQQSGEPVWASTCSDECVERFGEVVRKCGDCHDPVVVDFLTTAAAGLGTQRVHSDISFFDIIYQLALLAADIREAIWEHTARGGSSITRS